MLGSSLLHSRLYW